jgi:hypothetical protein
MGIILRSFYKKCYTTSKSVRCVTNPLKINTTISPEFRPLRLHLGVEFQRILECKACLLKILVLEKMLDSKFLFLGFC